MLHTKTLDEILQEIAKRWGLPGLAVGIVEGTETIFTREFGVQSLETQTPITPGSLFCIASISKCFVASAVMQLAERGTIYLDAPIVKYLPYFQIDDERYHQITIRQILSHTSGMPDLEESEYDVMMAHPEWDDGAAERFVRSLGNRKLVANPGEKFYYSNIAYNVLGDMIARVAGMSFEEYMKEHILDPSGMPDSTFNLAKIPPAAIAVPHLRTPAICVNPIYPYHRADAPSSFLHATITDMCHWGITCLNRGSYRGKSILPPTSYDMMWTPVADRGYSRPDIYEDMGLGWTLGHFKGTKTVSHGGMGFGWSAFYIIMPEQNRAAAILCNEESFAHHQILQVVADTLIGEMPHMNQVSWMVPISEALAQGGIQAAYTRYDEIKDSGTAEFYFDEYELLNLVIQLDSVKKIDMAIDVLGLNIHAYPAHLGSYFEQARLYLRKGNPASAKANLMKILSLAPGNTTAEEMLKMIP